MIAGSIGRWVAQPYAIGSRCAAFSRIACESSQSAGATRDTVFRYATALGG